MLHWEGGMGGSGGVQDLRWVQSAWMTEKNGVP